MKKILFYNIDSSKFEIYKKVASTFEIETILLNDENLEMTLEELFTLNTNYTPTLNDQLPMMIMQEIPQEQLVVLLQNFQNEGVPFDGIKVMRTDVNQSWKLIDVIQETTKEHEMVQKIMVLQQMLQTCNEIDMSKMDDIEKEEFKHAVIEAYIVLKSGSYDNEQVDHALKRLKHVLLNIKID